jgi:hypothetical protein
MTLAPASAIIDRRPQDWRRRRQPIPVFGRHRQDRVMSMSFAALHSALTPSVEDKPADALAHRLRACLQAFGARHKTFCREVPKETLLSRPHSTHQVADSSGQPLDGHTGASGAFIAAVVFSKWRGGLLAPDFLDGAARLGCFAGEAVEPKTSLSHASEFKASVAFWALPCPTAVTL